MLDPNHPIARLLARDDRYHFDAYVFVFEALRHAQDNLGMGTEYLAEDLQGFEEELDDDFDADELASEDFSEETLEQLIGSDEQQEPERHVTGQELCEAMRQYAHEQYGYLAKSVLNHWGIYSTGDFGEIVFNLIDIKQMKKTPSDRREDFENVFDFDEGFQHNFQFSLPDSSEEQKS